MKIIFYSIILLFCISGCSKEREVFGKFTFPDNSITFPDNSLKPPYSIPIIKTAEDFENLVYIDPEAVTDGNGSINSPRNIIPEFVENTAYLLKRGTTYRGSIKEIFTNILLGAYGEGDMPVVRSERTRALEILNTSSHSTIRDIYFTASGVTPYGVGIARVGESGDGFVEHITVAFCKFIGHNEDGAGVYPRNNIGFSGDDITFFNNEVAYNRSVATTISGTRIKIIRNWYHNSSKDSEEEPADGGMIASYFTSNTMYECYIAGNIFDRSNSMDKSCLFLNHPWAEETAANNIAEYNTAYPPKLGGGGSAFSWSPGTGNTALRYNVIKAIGLSSPMTVHEGNIEFDSPYGVRENLILREKGKRVNAVGYNIFLEGLNNHRFYTQEEYKIYLTENPEKNSYGSDIDTATFLTSEDLLYSNK